jgi:hypothetical protein
VATGSAEHGLHAQAMQSAHCVAKNMNQCNDDNDALHSCVWFGLAKHTGLPLKGVSSKKVPTSGQTWAQERTFMGKLFIRAKSDEREC